MSHSAAHSTNARQIPKNSPPKRPASIAELADRAMVDLWDESKDFKQYLRLAEKFRREGKERAKQGDIEGAFVELARAATLVLEKLPQHRDYNSMLNANQRHNLGLNGQDILDHLGDLKPMLVDRFDKWLQQHPEGIDQERTPNARTQHMANDDVARAQAQREQFHEEERSRVRDRETREQQRVAAEEAARWRQQREALAAQEDAERNRRRDAAAAAARKAQNIPKLLPQPPDYTFSRTPMQNNGYGSQSTVVLSDGRNQDDVVRNQQQLQEEMRQREEEITKRQAEHKRRQEQDGIARRQHESEEAARAARHNLAAPSISYPPTGTPSTMSTSSASPMFPNHSGSSSLATTPSSSFYQPTPVSSAIEYPSIIRTPNQPDHHAGHARPMIMPLENPSTYEGDSTDSESLHQYDYRRFGKQRADVDQHRTPTTLRPLRSPSYPPPITTTSPIPGAGPIRYPSLMSQHQKTQGYYPSLGSMFSDAANRNHGASLLLAQNSTDARTAGSTSLYAANQAIPGISSAPVQAPYPYSNQHPQQASNAAYLRPPPPLPNAPNHAPPSMATEADRIIHATDPKLGPTKALKTVSLPRECLPRFLAIARVNTEQNRETCGLLLGKDKGHKYAVTTLLIPKQHSTSDTCTMDEEELVLQFTEERSLITLGWIHTHPTQSCFMSSVDLHTHSGFQCMLPESFAVVCAPKFNPNFGIFRLTDPPGLPAILECKAKDAFHPHPDIPIYTDADKGHVQMKDSSLEIVDLR
ncbi:hypothetical protein B0H34DRAFT_723155 [Crassisporium funariophilum]|nr:hypothetical protein B0H34DRAFT_723155 [Crassisporium funariophilum]